MNTDTQEAAEPKHRTITLTDRAPVRIREDEWPVISHAIWESSENSSQSDRYQVRVRQHKDGRAIVYATFVSQWGNVADRRAGYLVEPAGTPSDLIGHIAQVVREIAAPDQLLRDAIADLPPENI